MISLIILKIVSIALLLRIIWLIIFHLFVVFYDKATEEAIDEILKNPKKHVRDEHVCSFMYDLVWLYIFIKLIIYAFSGQITID